MLGLSPFVIFSFLISRLVKPRKRKRSEQIWRESTFYDGEGNPWIIYVADWEVVSEYDVVREVLEVMVY